MRRFPFVFMFVLTMAWGACGGGDSDCTVVGPAGGTVTGPDGVLLVIPAGALSEDTCINIRLADGSPHGYLPAGPLYELRPHGLSPGLPAHLRAGPPVRHRQLRVHGR
jgi:hypothetical protein